jgi:hypothetical protein
MLMAIPWQIRLLVKCVWRVSLAFLAVGLLFIVLSMVLHRVFYVCPFQLSYFGKSGCVPVVYGLLFLEGFESVRRGEIAWGGCVPSTAGAVCPYCGWTVRLTASEPQAVALDDKSLEGLSPPERWEVRTYAAKVVRQARAGKGEKCTAVLVTPTDVWLGTLYSGLHRLDRQTVVWKFYERDTIGRCINRIWSEGDRVFVEHDPFGDHTFFREIYSDDRGESWLPS